MHTRKPLSSQKAKKKQTTRQCNINIAIFMRDSVFEICYFRNNFLRGRLRKALSKESIGQAVGNIGLASVIQKK